jgi:peptide chain release factor 1
MTFVEKLELIVAKHSAIGEKLGDPSALGREEFVSLSKEYSELSDVVGFISEYLEAANSVPDLEEMLAGDDADMKEMATEELAEIKARLPKIEHSIKVALLPKQKNDDKNVIIEVRAGTGGDEAALFAGDLLGMYLRYADKNKWKHEILSTSDSDSGGYKDATVAISGKNVFKRLKFESGVHRVQRVPATETQGRVHTSAATVAVLPEAEDVDVNIVEADLKIDIYRASGPGGQSVNTTDSAVRITHIPTGVVVQNQDQKSQHKNKEKAMRILKTRIYEVQQAKIDAERSADRKSQIGSGDRSERIRTYNYPQGRVSDHRINLTLYRIDEIVNGGELDEIIDALTAEDQATKLSEAV